jgi:hypothetical protein
MYIVNMPYFLCQIVCQTLEWCIEWITSNIRGLGIGVDHELSRINKFTSGTNHVVWHGMIHI